jgi:hypothetical protein
MLGDMGGELGRVANFLGFSADAERVLAIVSGPLMKRYSKALEFEYSPALRDELIAQEIRYQGREIDAALAMLRVNSEKSLLLARALERTREA